MKIQSFIDLQQEILDKLDQFLALQSEIINQQ